MLAIMPMALIGDIEDVGDKEVAGKQLDYVLHLIHVNQVHRTGFPKPNKYREVGQLPFKEGELVTSFYAHQIITSDGKGECSDITSEYTNTIVGIMGGNGIALLNFVEEFTGDKFIVGYEECETGTVYMLGTPSNPMILKSFNREDNLTKRALTITFENNSWRQPYIYTGSLPKADPIVNDADSDTLTLVPDQSTYLLPGGTSQPTPITKVAGITNDDQGRVVTLKGNAGNNPSTIEDGSVFILVGGDTWTASRGCQISFRVLDASRLVEVPNSRV